MRLRHVSRVPPAGEAVLMKPPPGMNMRFTGKTEEKNGAKFAEVEITFNGEKIEGFVEGGTISYKPTDLRDHAKQIVRDPFGHDDSALVPERPGDLLTSKMFVPNAFARTIEPTVGKLKAWAAKHASGDRYCKAGPWRDADVHVYRVMRCPCGEKFTWSESEEKASPGDFEL